MSLNPEFKFAKLPWIAGRSLFKHSSVADLMNIAQATQSTDWLTEFTSVPTKFSVDFISYGAGSQDHWEIRMNFADNDSSIWYLWPNTPKTWGIEKPNNPADPIILHSFMIGFHRTFVDVVDWLEKLFNCNVKKVDTLLWKNAKKVSMHDRCTYSAFLNDLWPTRHAKGFRTFIHHVEYENPRRDISYECLSSLDYKTASLDFTTLDNQEIKKYIENLMASEISTNFQVLVARIPDWTKKEVKNFGQHFNLEPYNGLALVYTHFSPEWENRYRYNLTRPVFQYNQNEETVLVFSFSKKSGVKTSSHMAVVARTVAAVARMRNGGFPGREAINFEIEYTLGQFPMDFESEDEDVDPRVPPNFNQAIENIRRVKFQKFLFSAIIR
ncbi:hypothetical protein GCK72_020567 [Caenorhabditis remanei]|uniref:Uncharacterized protein n=1 Tax=Caenorhabditis remanei TaxID=31234 RepID=A0A6A5GHT9_CAERE|nr:hypothetical protein GCK72_020567 [Caenorhabditis remanei]KAF1754009.1 hypothetical protein GCK72_020567 [Caenorhabditis remanei]